MTERIYYSDEAKEVAQQRQTAMVTAALAVGALVGAALAWLFGSKQGAQVREQVTDALQEHYEDGRQTASSAIDTMSERSQDMRSMLDKKLNELDKALADVSELRDQLNGKNLKERLTG